MNWTIFWFGMAHLIGDYVLQSDWMATQKTKRVLPALVHVLIYTSLYGLVTQSWQALLFIGATHFAIDHWRLARFVVYVKANYLGPKSYHKPWSACVATGYGPDSPPWLAFWLLIIVDNTMHLLCNGLAIYVWGVN